MCACVHVRPFRYLYIHIGVLFTLYTHIHLYRPAVYIRTGFVEIIMMIIHSFVWLVTLLRPYVPHNDINNNNVYYDYYDFKHTNTYRCMYMCTQRLTPSHLSFCLAKNNICCCRHTHTHIKWSACLLIQMSSIVQVYIYTSYTTYDVRYHNY